MASNQWHTLRVDFRDIYFVVTFDGKRAFVWKDETFKEAGKVGVSYVLARLARINARRLQLAVGLGQVGEFSFVLPSLGVAAGELDRPLYSAMLGAVALTIAASSVAVRLVAPAKERGAAVTSAAVLSRDASGGRCR